jgi:hypothetical protein
MCAVIDARGKATIPTSAPICLASTRQITANAPLGIAAVNRQRRRLDRFRLASRKRLAILADLAEQRVAGPVRQPWSLFRVPRITA